MPNEHKRNSMLCLSLAAFFGWGFMFAKHDPALRPIIPFGDDPYDAVGSFAIFVAMAVAVIAVVRAFRRKPAQTLYVIRAQTTVVLVVLITVGADAVAMARHAGMWMHSPARAKLIALLAGLVLAAVVVQRLIARSEHGERSQPPRWRTIGIAAVVGAAVLAVYPESLIVGVWTHLLTIVVSAVILFALTRALLMAIVPDVAVEGRTETIAPRRFLGRGSIWAIVTLTGAAFGAFAVIGEMSEGTGGQPIARVVAVVIVFVGLAIAGVLVAFGFLGAPLGLVSDPRG